MTKYLYLLTAGMLMFCAARAQLKKGESILLVYLYIQQEDNNYSTSIPGKFTSFNLGPSFGVAVSDNLMVGGTFSYGYSKAVTTNGVDPSYTLNGRTYGPGFFIRRYREVSRKFSVFMEADLDALFTRQKGSYEGANSLIVDAKGYIIIGGLAAGIAYRLARHWWLETGFRNLLFTSYTHNKDDGTNSPDPQRYNTMTVGTNLNNALNNFVIGCRYILN
jgi:hypothetical protein